MPGESDGRVPGADGAKRLALPVWSGSAWFGQTLGTLLGAQVRVQSRASRCELCHLATGAGVLGKFYSQRRSKWPRFARLAKPRRAGELHELHAAGTAAGQGLTRRALPADESIPLTCA